MNVSRHWKWVMPVVFVLLVVHLPGQTMAQIAPDLPEPSGPITPLIFREIPIAETAGRPLRIVRHGFAGTLSRPDVLDLEEEGGRAFALDPYDWITAGDRIVEVREWGAFHLLVALEAGAQGIILSENRFELAFGTLRWSRTSADALDFSVSSGPVTVSGRGEAVITRAVGTVSVEVVSGRLDLYRNGALVAVLGPGQNRVISIPDHPTDFSVAIAALRDQADTILGELVSDTVHGDSLAVLWERVLTVLPLYAALESGTGSIEEYPDIVLRDIAESLRYLASFRFSPPAQIGM